MGIRAPIARNTLANANRMRDWRIYADFAQSLIHTARRLYADEDFGVELDRTVYPLDSTTIDLCLTLFPWAHCQRTKGAVKVHTLLDLRGPIPAFIHITDSKVHDVNVLDQLLPEPVPSTSWIAAIWTSAGFIALHRRDRREPPFTSRFSNGRGYADVADSPGSRPARSRFAADTSSLRRRVLPTARRGNASVTFRAVVDATRQGGLALTCTAEFRNIA